MTRLEKLLEIQKAYYALIPGLKRISVPDYALALTIAPAHLKEMIEEEQTLAAWDANQTTGVIDNAPCAATFAHALHYACRYLIDQIGKRPELAYILGDTQALHLIVTAVANAEGKQRDDLENEVIAKRKTVYESNYIRRIIIKRLVNTCDIPLSQRRRYRNYTIWHAEKGKYCVFAPEQDDTTEAILAERDYTNLDDALRYVDNCIFDDAADELYDVEEEWH